MEELLNPPCKITHRESARFPNPKFEMWDTTKIKSSVTIDHSADIYLGPYVEIQDEVMIFTHLHKWNHSRGLRKCIEKIEAVPLRIEKDAFIGARAMLIGVRHIGEGAVIGAGAVVTKDVPAYEVWAGNPARKIGERSA